MRWLKAGVVCALGVGTYLALPELLVGWFGAAGAVAMIPGAGLAVAVLGWLVSASWKL
jgi:hypothetical protein